MNTQTDSYLFLCKQSEDTPESSPNPISIPPPLNVPPSRARRQFAARIAARRAEAEAAADADAAAEQQVALSREQVERQDQGASSGVSLSEDPRSDDSVDSEDVGIVMRKSVRSNVSQQASQQRPLGKSIFTLEGSGDDDEEDDDEGDAELEERKGNVVEALGRLGIDVKTPPPTGDD